MTPLFSIITVCYNAIDTIEETIKSVVCQKSVDFEYIIVDGQSTDGTLNIIKKYQDIPYLSYISEKDTGLYDAMNKAIDLAKGQFVLYLNSGDCLLNEDVLLSLAEVIRRQNLQNADLIYGNVVRKMPEGDIRETYGNRGRIKRMLLFGKMISHQVMFINISAMRKYRYDLSYKITADFNLLAKMVKNKDNLRYVDIDISIVENREGISEVPANLSIMREEDDRTIKDCFPIWYQILRPVKAIVRKIR